VVPYYCARALLYRQAQYAYYNNEEGK